MTQDIPAKRKWSCVGETDIELDAFSFVWSVTNYSVVSELEKVGSPVFHGGPKNNYGWQMYMYPITKEDGTKSLSLYVQLVNYGKSQSWWEWVRAWRKSPAIVKAKIRVAILNANGEAAYRNEMKVREFYVSVDSQCTWGWVDFISCASLANLKLVVDNKLKILCEVETCGELNQSVSSGVPIKRSSLDEQMERKKKCKFGVLDDLGKIFKESIATDVKIEAGKTSFKAHKTILAARSSVFAAMFNADMIEKKTATVKIKDFEDKVVKGMLEHLYIGETDCIKEQAPGLLQIAEKYDLKGLKEDSEHVIADTIDLQNAGIMLALAHSHNAPYLKQKAIEFINLNKEELVKSKKFRDEVKIHFDTGLFADLYLSPSQQ